MRLGAAVSSTLVWLPVTLGLFLRAEDESLVRMSWEKRSGRGEPIHVPLTIVGDGTYAATISMGTPFQEITAAVSLSQNYIVVATEDEGDASGAFIPTNSSSFTPESGVPPVQVPSPDGENPQSATFAGESCSLQGFNYNASLAFTPKTSAAKIFPNGVNGILGYGVDPVSTAPADSNLLAVYHLPTFTKGECGLQLNRGGESVGGILAMGGRDPNGFSGNFTSMVVPPATGGEETRPSWSVTLDGLTASGTGGSHSVPAGLASIDPLYPDISVPMGDVTQIYANVPGAKPVDSTNARYTVPCDAKINLKLTFGGREFTLDTRDGVVQEGTTCYGGVRGTTGNVYKVGSNFLRNVYTIFGSTVTNGESTFTVGFANRADSTTTGSAASPTSSFAPSSNGAPSFAHSSNLVVGVVVATLGLGLSAFL